MFLLTADFPCGARGLAAAPRAETFRKRGAPVTAPAEADYRHPTKRARALVFRFKVRKAEVAAAKRTLTFATVGMVTARAVLGIVNLNHEFRLLVQNSSNQLGAGPHGASAAEDLLIFRAAQHGNLREPGPAKDRPGKIIFAGRYGAGRKLLRRWTISEAKV